MRLVLDTNVIVAAMRSRKGAAARILELALDDQVQLFANLALALEYEEVASRPEHVTASGLGEVGARRFIRSAVGLMLPVDHYWTYRPRLSDPDDEMVLDAAINSNCHHIVTFNGSDFKGAEKFGIEAVTPGEILKRLQ
jgi:putative PIN family toxin of toxin-antitoxin system